jgi:phage terminase small subunit
MSKGRPKIPAAIKRARSKDGIRDSGKRLIVDEMQPTPGTPEVPIERSPEVRREIHRLTGELEGSGILTLADRQGIVALAKLWVAMQNTYAAAISEGVGSKYYSQYKQMTSVWMTLAAQYGLTPAGRVKIPAPTKKETETDDDF